MGQKSSKRDYSQLPSHIIAQILTSLDSEDLLNAVQVCKSWYSASYDPMVTRHICVRVKNKFQNLYELRRPFGTLSLYTTDLKSFEYRYLLKKFGQQITEVQFIKCVLSLQQLLDCIILMPNLSTLQIILDKIFTVENNILDCDYVMLETNLSCVKNLHINFNSFDSGSLSFLINMMPNLKKLFVPIVYTNLTTSFGYEFINRLNFDKLDELELGSMTHRIPDGVFDQFADIKSQLNVRSLKLRGVAHFHKFNEFCKKFANLRRFSMNCPEKGQDYMLITICRYMTRLTELELLYLRRLKLQPLRALQHLETLTLQYCKSSKDDLSANFSELENIKHLQITSLVTQDMLLSICQNCTNLTSLHLNEVDTDNYSAIFQYLRKLERLFFIFNEDKLDPDLNDKSLGYDITNLRQLEELTISELGPGMSVKLMSKLPFLKEVALEPARQWCGTFPKIKTIIPLK